MTAAIIFFVLSFAALVTALLWLFGAIGKRKLTFGKRFVWFLIFMVISAFCLRFPVALFGDNALPFSSSLLHTLQTFSLDEDYEECIENSKAMFESLFGDGFFKGAYAVYVSIVNVICAVSGGAVLYTVIEKLFPQMRLWTRSLLFLKRVCYFSALNDETVAFAKSLRDSEGKYKNALLVFCGVDEEDQKSDCSEQADLIDGIMVKTELADLRIMRRNGKKFILADSDDKNMQTLASFANEDKYSRLKPDDEILVLSENESPIIAKTVRDVLGEKLPSGAPTVFGVNRYRSLAFNLLKEHPLYTALNADDKDLSVVIFGSGRIGTELFLDAYWCGQMRNRLLRITVVSMEEEASFRGRIDHINSDILESANAGSELLGVFEDDENGNGVHNDPYFIFDYIKCDMRNGDLREKLLKTGVNGRPVDADYFVSALGTDKENIEIAELVRRIVTTDGTKAHNGQVPIACAIYDDELSKAILAQPASDKFKARIIPFGSLGTTYDHKNVLLDELKKNAENCSSSYDRAVNGSLKYSSLIKDEYSFWANYTRALSIKYKAYSVSKTVDEYIKETKQPDSEVCKEYGDELAWAEHRRWNAFMRVQGFKCPKDRETKKDLDLKVHPCLVECAKDRMDEKSSSAGHPDKLDIISEKAGCRYKEYDYPAYDAD